eukprot:211680-Chlamydomonas_euryale.AAC.1
MSSTGDALEDLRTQLRLAGGAVRTPSRAASLATALAALAGATGPALQQPACAPAAAELLLVGDASVFSMARHALASSECIHGMRFTQCVGSTLQVRGWSGQGMAQPHVLFHA